MVAPKKRQQKTGGFSVSTGRRIEQGKHQPNKGKPRSWRTRKDPFAGVWESELVPMLEREPQQNRDYSV
ncbi:MAG: hypothetical protein HC820_02250 [Hydrococcus sp. RM1_1_31]|nr:hypothetical protein [Hydrococcus sp. RM1_1_31]